VHCIAATLLPQQALTGLFEIFSLYHLDYLPHRSRIGMCIPYIGRHAARATPWQYRFSIGKPALRAMAKLRLFVFTAKPMG
jgi:hypothetical protein